MVTYGELWWRKYGCARVKIITWQVFLEGGRKSLYRLCLVGERRITDEHIERVKTLWQVNPEPTAELERRCSSTYLLLVDVSILLIISDMKVG